MKYDSLNWQQQKALVKIYDERHKGEIPVVPEEFEAPHPSARMTVATHDTTHVYVFMRNNRRGANECEGHLRVVGASEHLELEIDIDAIPKLISELQKLHQDMEHFNAEGRAHAERRRRYAAAKEAYEQKREKELKAAFISGKYTGKDIDAMIESAEILDNLDDIPF